MSASYIVVNKSDSKPKLSLLLGLITSNTKKVKNISSGNPDIMEIDLEEEKRSIGIGAVKPGVKFLAEKPYQEDYRYLVIYNADRLTTEAQNSLLKTLEEPPQQTIIFLVTRAAGALLDTINSRCRKLTLKHDMGPEIDSKLKNLLSMPIGERLAVAEELAKEDKATVIKSLNELAGLIVDKAKDSKQGDAIKAAHSLEIITKRIVDIDSTNVTVRLALEELFINL